MNRLEVDKEGNNDYWYSSRIVDQGDLSTYYGYETFDASGYIIKAGKISSHTLSGPAELNERDVLDMLKSGYTYVRSKNIPLDWQASPLPIHIIGEKYEVLELGLKVGINPTFLLEKDGEIHYAVVNGFLLDVRNYPKAGSLVLKNAMIYR